jgi:hypothetical protein
VALLTMPAQPAPHPSVLIPGWHSSTPWLAEREREPARRLVGDEARSWRWLRVFLEQSRQRPGVVSAVACHLGCCRQRAVAVRPALLIWPLPAPCPAPPRPSSIPSYTRRLPLACIRAAATTRSSTGASLAPRQLRTRGVLLHMRVRDNPQVRGRQHRSPRAQGHPSLNSIAA